LSEIIVHNEYAVGLEHPLDVGESLLGEKIAFETNIRITTVQDKGIDEGIDHNIVFAVGCAQKMPTVV
jgi:hypothetical protein